MANVRAVFPPLAPGPDPVFLIGDVNILSIDSTYDADTETYKITVAYTLPRVFVPTQPGVYISSERLS